MTAKERNENNPVVIFYNLFRKRTAIGFLGDILSGKKKSGPNISRKPIYTLSNIMHVPKADKGQYSSTFDIKNDSNKDCTAEETIQAQNHLTALLHP